MDLLELARKNIVTDLLDVAGEVVGHVVDLGGIAFRAGEQDVDEQRQGDVGGEFVGPSGACRSRP